MEKRKITAAVLAVCLAGAVFATGYFFGRTDRVGGFTVGTQYTVGGVGPDSVDRIAEDAGPSPAGPSPAGEGAGTELVDLNTADAETLAGLPGIGDVLARRIIAYREAHGPFRIVDEILDVEGIGEKKFEELCEQVTVLP